MGGEFVSLSPGTWSWSSRVWSGFGESGEQQEWKEIFSDTYLSEPIPETLLAGVAGVRMLKAAVLKCSLLV